MAKRDRSASLTQLLTEATTDGPSPTPEPEPVPEQKPQAQKTTSKERSTTGSATKAPKPGRGEARASAPPSKRSQAKRPEASIGGPKAKPADGTQTETTGEGHVRYSDGSYLRADGERRVALQLKMRPDDKQALKVQAAEAGLSPAEYVARLVREDAQ